MMKNKLIKLLDGKSIDTMSDVEYVADHLISNDVTVIKTVTVEELKALPLRAWVWIEVLEPFDYEEKVSAYYRKQEDCTHEKAFCCGYPGLSFSFCYEDYGKTWTAFTYKPKEVE